MGAGMANTNKLIRQTSVDIWEAAVETGSVSPLMALVEGAVWHWGLCLCICISTACLAYDYHGITETERSNIELSNGFFTVLFTIELICQCLVYPPKVFFRETANIFDCSIVVTGWVDILLNVSASAGPKVRAFLSATRAIRFLRLVEFIPQLRESFRVIAHTLASLGYVMALMALFIFIFSVFGMQLFGGAFTIFDPKPRWHYDTFMIAFGTTFQVMTFDNWNLVMYDAVQASGDAAIFYYIVWIIFGSYVLLNLLLVIILDVYVENADSEASAEKHGWRKETAKHHLEVIEKEKEEKAEIERQKDLQAAKEILQSKDKSLGIFGLDSQMRKACTEIATSSMLDHFIMVCIITNCVAMAFDTPAVAANPDSSEAVVLFWCDLFFTVIFIGECAVKVIAFGFLHSSSADPAYLADGWHVIDFGIVLISVIDLFAHAADISFLKTMRLLRALRALRMMTHMEGLKMLVSSLVDSALSLSAVLAVTLVIWTVFAIIGTTFFKGTFWSCSDRSGVVTHRPQCIGGWVDEASGEMMPRLWQNPHANFDSFSESMFALFALSTTNDWIHIAHKAIDGIGVDLQPVAEFAPIRMLFFITFIIMSNFFFMNLFVGVIYEKYIARKNLGLETLTKRQMQWVQIMESMSYVSAIPSLKARAAKDKKSGLQLSGLKIKILGLVTSSGFDHFIMGSIIANCATMALTFWGEPQWWTSAQNVLNVIFTATFLIECALKLFAFGPPQYFREGWNRFDFAVVVGSVLDIMCEYLEVQTFSSSMFRITRIAKVIGRVGRLLKVASHGSTTLGIEQILQVFTHSLPSLGYIAVLLLLILFIFAVLGMNFFGKIAHNGCIGARSNFEHVPIGMLTLFGVGTKDRVACTMAATMVQEPQCSEAEGTCGNTIVSKLYFVVFSFAIMFTTIEMFVNVILQRFEAINTAAGLPVTIAHMEAFAQVWQTFDPDGTGWIDLTDLQDFLDNINLPRQIGYDPLAGEDPIEFGELRMPPLPSGDFSRFLLDPAKLAIANGEEPIEEESPSPEGDSPSSPDEEIGSEVDAERASKSSDTSEFSSGSSKTSDRGSSTGQHQHRGSKDMFWLSMERSPSNTHDHVHVLDHLHLKKNEHKTQVNFDELLYALCERKTGTPLPSSNKVIQENRLEIGMGMPSMQQLVIDQVEAEKQEVRRVRLERFHSHDAVTRRAMKQEVKDTETSSGDMVFDNFTNPVVDNM